MAIRESEMDSKVAFRGLATDKVILLLLKRERARLIGLLDVTYNLMVPSVLYLRTRKKRTLKPKGRRGAASCGIRVVSLTNYATHAITPISTYQ
jgi:hypothetical protein